MTTFLIKEDSSWADEFGLQGFKIVRANNKEEAIEKITDTFSEN